MIHVLALAIIAVVLRHPEMMEDSMDPVLPTPLSEVEEPVVEIISPNLGPSIELSLKHQQPDDTRIQSSLSTAHGYHDIFTHRSLNHRESQFVGNARTLGLVKLIISSLTAGTNTGKAHCAVVKV
jgi:hypothetical protein